MKDLLKENIFDAIYFKSWSDSIDELENLAAKENWNFREPNPTYKNQKNPILENYIKHTYKRLFHEHSTLKSEEEKNKKIYISEDKCIFNTGLFTENYAQIFGVFSKNKMPNSKLPYYFNNFVDESSGHFQNIGELPTRAEYFTDFTDLIFDTKLPLRVSTYHILNSENRNRIPEKYRNEANLITLFTGAVELAQKIVEANYKAAVPQFYDNKISFLLPICLNQPGIADLSLSVIKNDNCYNGVTCLTLDMAYNNARLICKPDSEWLKI